MLNPEDPLSRGTTHIVMSPREFLQRLAALVPRPRLHLIRFHGVLARSQAHGGACLARRGRCARPASRDHSGRAGQRPYPFSRPRRGACPHELGPVAHKTAGSGF
ncbi:MAG: transposase [Gammaproteobacteria bacterium]